MANFLSKSRNKALVLILIACLVIFLFNIPSVFRGQFIKIKLFAEKSAGDLLKKDVSVGSIGFLPYGDLVFRDIEISDIDSGAPYIFIKRCHVRLSILESLVSRRIVIGKVILSEPVFYPAFMSLIKNITAAPGFYKNKVRLGSRFLIKLVSGNIIFPDSNCINADLRIRSKGGGRIYSVGRVDFGKSRLNYNLLDKIGLFNFINAAGYRMEGSVSGDELLIDNLLLDFGHFKVDADGSVKDYLKNPALNLNVRLKELSIEEKAAAGSRLLISAIREFMLNIKGRPEEQNWSINLYEMRAAFPFLPGILRVDNFYCNLRISRDELVIEDLACFLNNFPIGLKCRVSEFQSPCVELKLRSYPGQIASLRPFNPLNFDISFSGRKTGNVVSGDAFFETERIVSVNPRKTRGVKISASGLNACLLNRIIANKDSFLISLGAKKVVYETDMPARSIKMEASDCKALLYPGDRCIHIADLSAAVYEGSVQGKGFLDFNALPPRILADFRFKGLSVPELATASNIDYEAGGELSGKGVFNSNADTCISGEIAVSDGYVKGAKILGMIADFLSIKSLRDIYFDGFFSRFSFSRQDKEIRLESIRVISKDMSLKADIRLKNLQKLNGRLSIRLTTALLRESFRLRMLFFLIGERLPYEDFEFEIGGLAGFPHMKWLDTRFKDSIRHYLSESGKLAMEKSLEDAIEQLVEP